MLAEHEFAQLVRLSASAGPRLQWSLENSLSPWAIFFKKAGLAELHQLLAITDQVRLLCFRLPAKKGEAPDVFKYGSLAFLQYRASNWRRPMPHLHDQASLVQHWLWHLNSVVISTTWNAFHSEYTKMIQPWLHVADTKPFRNIPDVGKAVASYDSHYEAFTINELSSFIAAYQNLRRVRAEALATELRNLADIYEAHPDRVKMPFAPQTHRPNQAHISSQMRAEANGLIRRATNGR